MVDTSTLAGVLRASRREEPRDDRLDVNDFVSGYLRNQQAIANEAGKGGGTLAADALVRAGVVPEGVPTRVAAFAGDMVSDPLNIIGAGVAGAGVKAGARAATNPTNQARANALLGRLLHGNEGAPWSVAQSRPVASRVDNWFAGDLFAVPNFELASKFAKGGPVYRLGNLPKNLNVLDLMPKGKSVSEQSSGLAEELARMGFNNFDNVMDDTRHIALTNIRDDSLKNLLHQYGFNALRHQSGEATKRGTYKPVYQFFDPAGITATPANAFNRMMSAIDVPAATQRVVDPIRSQLSTLMRRLNPPPVAPRRPPAL